MMKGKRGSVMIGVITAIMIFFAGMLFVNFLKDDVTTARDSSHLDCSNSTISDGVKVTCLAVDVVVPYFIVIVISAAGGFVFARLNI